MTDRIQPIEGPERIYTGRPAPQYVQAGSERENGRTFKGLPDPVAALRMIYTQHGIPANDEQRKDAITQLGAMTKHYQATGELVLGAAIEDIAVEFE